MNPRFAELSVPVEELLIRSRAFRLPGLKQLHQSAYEWKILALDVTETPLLFAQKKNNVATINSPDSF